MGLSTLVFDQALRKASDPGRSFSSASVGQLTDYTWEYLIKPMPLQQAVMSSLIEHHVGKTRPFCLDRINQLWPTAPMRCFDSIGLVDRK